MSLSPRAQTNDKGMRKDSTNVLGGSQGQRAATPVTLHFRVPGRQSLTGLAGDLGQRTCSARTRCPRRTGAVPAPGMRSCDLTDRWAKLGRNPIADDDRRKVGQDSGPCSQALCNMLTSGQEGWQDNFPSTHLRAGWGPPARQCVPQGLRDRASSLGVPASSASSWGPPGPALPHL